MKHYHVLNGIPGCLPDNNQVYKTKQEAKEGLKWTVSQLRDIEPYQGNLNHGRFNSIHGFYYAEISDPCYESECIEDLEDDI